MKATPTAVTADAFFDQVIEHILRPETSAPIITDPAAVIARYELTMRGQDEGDEVDGEFYMINVLEDLSDPQDGTQGHMTGMFAKVTPMFNVYETYADPTPQGYYLVGAAVYKIVGDELLDVSDNMEGNWTRLQACRIRPAYSQTDVLIPLALAA